jgi:hypothetical protein
MTQAVSELASLTQMSAKMYCCIVFWSIAFRTTQLQLKQPCTNCLLLKVLGTEGLHQGMTPQSTAGAVMQFDADGINR